MAGIGKKGLCSDIYERVQSHVEFAACVNQNQVWLEGKILVCKYGLMSESPSGSSPAPELRFQESLIPGGLEPTDSGRKQVELRHRLLVLLHRYPGIAFLNFPRLLCSDQYVIHVKIWSLWVLTMLDFHVALKLSE